MKEGFSQESDNDDIEKYVIVCSWCEEAASHTNSTIIR